MDFEKLIQKYVAQAHGVTTRSIRKWEKAGMPRNRDGTYSLPETISWRIDQISGDEMESDQAYQFWSVEFRKERALKAKAEREETENRLFDKEVIEKEWTARLIALITSLESLAERMPMVLEGKNREQMRKVISDEIRKYRDEYARNGRYCPKLVSKRIDGLETARTIKNQRVDRKISNPKKRGRKRTRPSN